MLRLIILLVLIFGPWITAEGKLPDITPAEATAKLNEIVKSHATYKQLSPLIVKRALLNYLDELDPSKTYFMESDIQAWQEPSDALLEKILTDYEHNKFDTFASINEAMVKAIARRRQLELAGFRLFGERLG